MRWSRYPKLESRNEVAGAPLITRRRAPGRCTQVNSRHNSFSLKRLVIELRIGDGSYSAGTLSHPWGPRQLTISLVVARRPS